MKVIIPDWHVPNNVKVLTTTRTIDQPENKLIQNNASLLTNLNLPESPLWLEQTHSDRVVDFTNEADNKADASLTRTAGQVLALVTADCLPIVIASLDGNEIAVVHAGWRGLYQGILEKTMLKMRVDASNCVAWIGPAICGHCFAVDNSLVEQFVTTYPWIKRYCFVKEQWHINLPAVAAHILRLLGCHRVYQSNLCTYEQKNLFYSYRRERQTGRMATFVWFE